MIIFLSLALALSLAACSGGDGGKAPSESPSPTESSKTPSDEARSDENRYYGIGEAAEANGLSVTIDKVAVAEANTTLEKAKDSFEYIKVWFTFKNISNETIESPKAKSHWKRGERVCEIERAPSSFPTLSHSLVRSLVRC